MTRWSRYFSGAEIECRRTVGDSRRPHGCLMPLAVQERARALAAALDVLRDHLGRPVLITSWYRCPARNAEVGGTPASHHMRGHAADIWALGYDGPGLRKVIEGLIAEGKIPDGGVGTYPEPHRRAIVHYDLGPAGRRWGPT